MSHWFIHSSREEKLSTGGQRQERQRRVGLELGLNQNSSITTVVTIKQTENEARTKCWWLSKSTFTSFLYSYTEGPVWGWGLGIETRDGGGRQQEVFKGYSRGWEGETLCPGAQQDCTGVLLGAGGDQRMDTPERRSQDSAALRLPYLLREATEHTCALQGHAPADRLPADPGRNHFRAIP